MGRRLEGKVIAQPLEASIIKKMQMLEQMGVQPQLALVRIGDSAAAASYEKSIINKAKTYGIKVKSLAMNQNVTNEAVVKEINKLNEDPQVHGIMFFTPLPKGLDENLLRSTIAYIKDVDCLNILNYGNVFGDNEHAIMPCTAKSALAFIMYAHDNNVEGKNIAIVNASRIIGLPLAVLLGKRRATVTLCNSFTTNVPEITKASDIVVVGTGNAKMFDASYFKDTATVIDVGLSMDQDGQLAGDVDYDAVIDHVEYLTYYRNGVGLVTTIILLSHVVECCLQNQLTNK